MRHIYLFIEGILATLWIFLEKIIEIIVFGILPRGTPVKKTGYSASFEDPKVLLARSHLGFCLTGDRSLSTENSYKNSLVIGGTGVGKSSVVLLPSLYRMKGSFVVHDPSGELYQKSAGYLQKRGYTIKTLNFADPEHSDGFNPLSRIKTSSDIHKVASLVIRTVLGNPSGDPFWNLQATSLLTLLITLVKGEDKDRQTFYQVKHYLNQLSGESERFAQKINGHDDLSLRAEYKTFQSYDDKVKAGVIATVASALNIFTDESIAKVTSHDTMSLHLFRVRKTALFIQNPVSDQSYYAVLSSLFFEQLFGALLNRIPKQWDHDVFCLIDEAGVLHLPSLANTIANIRKYRAGILLAVQDRNQLIQHYGVYQARTIENNCFSRLYFTGQSGQTAEELEHTLGRYQYEDNQGKTQVRPLLTRDEVRTMANNRALLMAGNHRPMIVKLIPYYQNRWLQGFANIPAPYHD